MRFMDYSLLLAVRRVSNSKQSMVSNEQSMALFNEIEGV